MEPSSGNSEEGKGIKASHVAKGTFIFGTVAGLYILGLWGLCYLVSPSRFIVNHLPWQFVKDAYKKGTEKAQHAKFLQRVPEAYRGRLTISFGEMVAVKIIIGPVALPLKLWLTMKILQFTNSS